MEKDFIPRNEKEKAALNLTKLQAEISSIPGTSEYKKYLEGYLQDAVESYRNTYRTEADYDKPFAFNYLNEPDFVHEQMARHLDEMLNAISPQSQDRKEDVAKADSDHAEVRILRSESEDPFFQKGKVYPLDRTFIEMFDKRGKELGPDKSENLELQISVGREKESIECILKEGSPLAKELEKRIAFLRKAAPYADNFQDEKADLDKAEKLEKLLLDLNINDSNHQKNSESKRPGNEAVIEKMSKLGISPESMVFYSQKDCDAYLAFLKTESDRLHMEKRDQEAERIKAFLKARMLDFKKLAGVAGTLLGALSYPSFTGQYRYFRQKLQVARHKKMLRMQAKKEIAAIRKETRRNIKNLDSQIQGTKREEKLLEKPNAIFNGQKQHQGDWPSYEERVVERVLQQAYPENYGTRYVRSDKYKAGGPKKEDKGIYEALAGYVKDFKEANAKYMSGDKLTNYGYVHLKKKLMEMFEKAQKEVRSKDISQILTNRQRSSVKTEERAVSTNKEKKKRHTPYILTTR